MYRLIFRLKYQRGEPVNMNVISGNWMQCIMPNKTGQCSVQHNFPFPKIRTKKNLTKLTFLALKY